MISPQTGKDDLDYLKNILDKKLLLYEMLINVSNLFAIKNIYI